MVSVRNTGVSIHNSTHTGKVIVFYIQHILQHTILSTIPSYPVFGLDGPSTCDRTYFYSSTSIKNHMVILLTIFLICLHPTNIVWVLPMTSCLHHGIIPVTPPLSQCRYLKFAIDIPILHAIRGY